MEVKCKDKFIKKLYIYKHLKFINFETKIEDDELKSIINALNIKNSYLRKKYILENTCIYIDNYYSGCSACNFKNNRCICHRKINKEYINGCCRKCKYQSIKGCKTNNVACKLFFCSYADIGNKKKLMSRDILLLKVLNPLERYIVINDYFRSIKKVIFDLYLYQFLLIFIFTIQVILQLV